MKKFSYLLIFIFSFIFVINVSADTYNELFDTNIAASGQFFNYSSNKENGSSAGYVFDLADLNGSSYTYVLPSSTYSLGTYGMSLSQCGLSFLKDNYYSVSYYFIGIGTYIHPTYSALTYKLGLGTSYNDSNWLNFNYDTVSAGVEQVEIESGVYLMVFTNIFKAYKNATCVSMAYSSQNHSLSSYYAGFVGYRYQSLGSKPLSQSDIQNALTQNFTNIENKINDMKTEQQETNDKLDDTNDKLDNIESSITDDTPPNLDGLNDSAGWLPAGPIDSILNLPLALLNNLTDNLSNTCQPVNLPLPYIGENLTLPCLNTIYSEIDGLNTWITTIGTIASAFMLFAYFMRLYKWVDDTLTLRENNYIDNWGGI